MTRGRDRNLAWIVDRTGLADPKEALAAAIARPPNAHTAHAVAVRLGGGPAAIEHDTARRWPGGSTRSPSISARPPSWRVEGDPRQQQIKIVRGAPLLTIGLPKGGKARVVPLPEVTAVELAQHLRRYPPGVDDLVFTSRAHKPLNRNYFNTHVWRPALLTAGVAPAPVTG